VCEKSSSGLVFSIVAVVFAVALLVFTILCKNNAAELFELSEENTTKVGGLSTCITALVFTLLSLGVSIVQSIHKTREEKADIIAF
jgi:hypothetical protein